MVTQLPYEKWPEFFLTYKKAELGGGGCSGE